MRASLRSARLGALFAAVSSAGCQVVFGYDDFSAGEEIAPHPCDTLPERKVDDQEATVMVRVNLLGSECVWIDREEVTVERYERWVSTTPEAEVRWDDAFCAWKSARSTPQAAEDVCGTSLRDDELQPFASGKPIRCVDFCDADAFCRWAGKRLCYDRAVTGVQAPMGVPREWTQACSNGLKTVYPWGDEPRTRATCQLNQQEEDNVVVAPGPIAVGTTVGCINEVGVSDLLGNVAEWTYGCNVDSTTVRGEITPCQIKGGGFDQPLASCLDWELAENDTRRPNLGFRCCASLTAEERLLVDAP